MYGRTPRRNSAGRRSEGINQPYNRLLVLRSPCSVLKIAHYNSTVSLLPRGHNPRRFVVVSPFVNSWSGGSCTTVPSPHEDRRPQRDTNLRVSTSAFRETLSKSEVSANLLRRNFVDLWNGHRAVSCFHVDDLDARTLSCSKGHDLLGRVC